MTLVAACSFDAGKLRRSVRDAASPSGTLDAAVDQRPNATSDGAPDVRSSGDLAKPADAPELADLKTPVDLAGAGAGGASGTGGILGSGTGGGGGEAGGGPMVIDSGLDGPGSDAAGLEAGPDVASDGETDAVPDAPVATNDGEAAVDGEADVPSYDGAVVVDGEADVPSYDGAVSAEAGNACTGHVAPIAYYPCESASGNSLADLSGNGNNATLLASSSSSSAYSFVAGKVGSAMEFSANGSGYALLPAQLLSKACAATITLWLFVDTSSSWQRAFDFGVSQSAYMFLTTNTSTTNRMRFAITASGYQNEQYVDTPRAFPTGSWHHVAAVLDASGGRIYLDGAEVGANPGMTLRPSDVGGGSNYYIGRSQFSADAYLDGKLDELRIYDRALSAAEIQALMTGL